MKLKDVLSIFPPKPPVHGEKARRALRRKAASLAATGNVLVQCGFFATREDLDERKRLLLYPDHPRNPRLCGNDPAD